MSKLNLDFAAEYGVYTKVLQCRDGVYVIGSLDPITDDISPINIIRRNERNKQLFYPHTFGAKIKDNDNIMLFIEKFLKYCKEAEFIKNIYAEYNLSVPERLRRNELSELIRFKTASENLNYDNLLRDLHKKSINKFFKHESKCGLYKSWRKFYRSERYDSNAGKLSNFIRFLKRKTPKTDIDILLGTGETVKRIAMHEHEYKEFKKTVKEYYPNIQFAVSKKYIVNHGMIDIPGIGKAVTFEEFVNIRDKQFSSKGYGAFADLNVSYWEFRDISFKIADEPIIAEIYNNINLRFVNCMQLHSLRDRGDICYTSVPVDDIMDFSYLANVNDLKFYIDKWGEFEPPSLDTVCIVYNLFDENKVTDINNVILQDKIQFSHAIPKEPLALQITSAEKKLPDSFLENFKPYEKAI